MNYEHGLPFSEILGDNLKDLITRVDNKKASLIIIDGGVGEGKTTLLIHILNYINACRGLPPIDIAGCQLAMGGADFLRKIRECYENKLPCVGYDEAGDFNKRGSLSGFNSMLNRTFETFRAFKCIVVIALPNFAVLDNQLFDNRIPRMLIHLYDRTPRKGNFDAYGLREMEFLKYYMIKSAVKSYAWGRVYPNFFGHFLDLDPEDSKQLDSVSTKNKLKILRKNEMLIEGLIPIKEIALKIQRSIPSTMAMINELGIKRDRKIGGASYYNNEIINKLSEHLDYKVQNDKRHKNTGRPRPVGRPKKQKH